MFLIPEDDHDLRDQADELPRPHACSSRSTAAQLPRAAAALRRGGAAAPQRAGRHAARPHPRAARHPGRRAHLLHPRADRGRDLRLPRLREVPSTTCSGSRSSFELSTRPENKLGTDEEWDFTEARARKRRSSGAGSSTSSTRATARSTARRSTCTCATRSAARGRWAPSSSTARCRSASGCRYVGRRQRRAHPGVIHRALIGSFERFIGILHRALRAARSRSGSRRCRCAILPVGRGHREAAHALAGAARAATASRSTTPTRPSASGSGTPRSRRSRSSIVYGDKESDESLAVREHGGGQSTLSLADFRAKLATLEPWQAGAEPSLTSWPRAYGGSTEFNRGLRDRLPLHASGFCRSTRRSLRAW